MEMLHAWMIAQRDVVPEGSAISRALDYSLKRWEALSRLLACLSLFQWILPGAMQVNNVQTYHAAGLAGIGLIQAGYLALAHHIKSGDLVEILPDLRPEPLSASLVVAHRRNLSQRVRAFMTWIESVLEPYFD